MAATWRRLSVLHFSPEVIPHTFFASDGSFAISPHGAKVCADMETLEQWIHAWLGCSQEYLNVWSWWYHGTNACLAKISNTTHNSYMIMNYTVLSVSNFLFKWLLIRTSRTFSGRLIVLTGIDSYTSYTLIINCVQKREKTTDRSKAWLTKTSTKLRYIYI